MHIEISWNKMLPPPPSLLLLLLLPQHSPDRNSPSSPPSLRKTKWPLPVLCRSHVGTRRAMQLPLCSMSAEQHSQYFNNNVFTATKMDAFNRWLWKRSRRATKSARKSGARTSVQAEFSRLALVRGIRCLFSALSKYLPLRKLPCRTHSDDYCTHN